MGRVTALTADGTDIYAVGNFDAGVSGSTIIYSTNIIKWDGTSWHAMGTPAGNGVIVNGSHGPEFYKVAVSGSNVFLAGLFWNTDNGGFPTAPIGLDRFSTNCSHVQAYSLLADTNGTRAAGLDLSAWNGKFYVAGDFNYIDNSTSVTGVARWNNESWSIIGNSYEVNGPCTAAEVDPAGTVVFVNGTFDHADGVALPNGTPIRWTGN